MTFRELEIIVAFSRTEHLGKAAEELGCSISSVQRTLHALEARLGVALVEPDGRRLRLLQTGRVLAEYAVHLLRTRVDAVEATITASGKRSHALRVGHLITLGLAVAPQLIDAVLAREPDIHVQLHTGSTSSLIMQLLAGNLDVVLVSPTPRQPDLIVVPLFSEPVLLAVAASDPLAQLNAVDLGTLRARHFVAAPDGVGARQDLLTACARAGFIPNVTIEVQDKFTLESMVGTGRVIAIVPESMCAYPNPRVARIPLIEKVPTLRTVGIVYPRNASMTAGLRALLSAATEIQRTYAPPASAPEAKRYRQHKMPLHATARALTRWRG